MPLISAIADMPPLFALLAVMLLSVVLVSLLFLRVRQSLLVAYFLCGVFIANSGVLEALAGVDAGEKLRPMAEMGVILLLFTVGLEFSVSDLKYVGHWAFRGGFSQVAICLLAGCGLAWASGFVFAQALVLGGALVLSSTAVSVKSFQDMELSASSGARFTIAVSIFQDLFIVIGFFLLLPVLAPTGTMGADVHWSRQLVELLVKGLLFVALSIALAKWVFPRLFRMVVRSRSRELFTLTVFGLCLGVAFLSALLNLSLALGAFVAGLAVSESIYKHRILADVQPLKNLFLTLFFVSVGLLIEVKHALALWPAILALTGGMMLFKTLVVVVIARVMGLRWQAALLSGLSLSSASEFSVVLLQRFGDLEPWPGEWDQAMLVSIALSMGLVPVLMRAGIKWSEWLERRFPVHRHAPPQSGKPDRQRLKVIKDHAIVCGYGPVGQSLVESLEDRGVPTLIIELNADTVHDLHLKGHLAFFADVSHEETWDLARVEHARLVAFTFPLTEITVAAQELVRSRNRGIPIMARTKFRGEAKKLEALGVDVVVHDERESARAMIREALHLDSRREPEEPVI